MTWKDSFSIGIPEIDRQHRELCDHVDKLNDACVKGRAIEEVKRLLDFLTEYTLNHFADEEALQLRINYPGYDQHKEKHAAFLTRVEELNKETAQRGFNTALVIKISQVVAAWLDEHIIGSDSDLRNYV